MATLPAGQVPAAVRVTRSGPAAVPDALLTTSKPLAPPPSTSMTFFERSVVVTEPSRRCSPVTVPKRRSVAAQRAVLHQRGR